MSLFRYSPPERHEDSIELYEGRAASYFNNLEGGLLEADGAFTYSSSMGRARIGADIRHAKKYCGEEMMNRIRRSIVAKVRHCM